MLGEHVVLRTIHSPAGLRHVSACEVRFGRDLIAPQFAALTAKFRELASEVRAGSLYVDTVFAAEAPEQSAKPASDASCCVLLDVHRLFTFRAGAGCASIPSVRRFVMDDHAFRGDRPLVKAMNGSGYQFLYPLESLDVLPALWNYLNTGVTTVDLSTAEITVAAAIDYPKAPRAIITTPLSIEFPPAIELDDCEAGADWRCHGGDGAGGLTSRFTGVIRNEYIRYTATSIPCATARVLWNKGREEALCGGVSVRAEQALAIARCEALERFQVAFMPEMEPLVRARYPDLTAAVDPALLFFQGLAEQRPDPRQAPMYWTAVTRITQHRQLLAPAQEVWFGTDRLPGETMCIRPTTNGCALGNSVSEAALFAILELIERDAYLLMWYLRSTRGKLNLASLRYEPVNLLLARLKYKFPQYRMHAFDIRSDVPVPAIAVVGVRAGGSGPKTLHAAAARPTAAHALYAALKDLALSLDMVGGQQRRNSGWTAPESEELVNSPDDHRAFYARDDNFPRLSFLDLERPGDIELAGVDSTRCFGDLPPANLRDAVIIIAEAMERLGLAVLLKNITHDFSAARGLYCVKAIVPGMFPMWYGPRNLRFALTDRLCRIGADRGSGPVTGSSVNLQAHPFG